MSAILYYLALPFLYLVSCLPFRVLHLLSGILYLLVYRVFGYRKAVVNENLRNAFPDKTPAEIDTIREGYYRYFCDLILEVIKALTITPAASKRCFVIGDISALERYYKQNQSVIVVMGHLGNWELAGSILNLLPIHQVYALYHPLSSQHFDRLFYRLRTRLGTKLYSMRGAFKGMIRNRKELTATVFIADQTPTPKNAHWMTFLNQDTAVFKGTESIAKALEYPVLYLSVIRQKRGVYKLECELLLENPKEFAEHEITELHTRRLERDIIDHPETWLWSHRRWKHKKPE